MGKDEIGRGKMIKQLIWSVNACVLHLFRLLSSLHLSIATRAKKEKEKKKNARGDSATDAYSNANEDSNRESSKENILNNSFIHQQLQTHRYVCYASSCMYPRAPCQV